MTPTWMPSFVVPPWTAHQFNATSRTVFFSFSDRAAQEALGFWREEKSI